MTEANPPCVLQQMQSSEINFKLECFWDAGFLWMLGDELNGYIADGAAQTMEETVEALKQAALKHYPESVFAKQQAPAAPTKPVSLREAVRRARGGDAPTYRKGHA